MYYNGAPHSAGFGVQVKAVDGKTLVCKGDKRGRSAGQPAVFPMKLCLIAILHSFHAIIGDVAWNGYSVLDSHLPDPSSMHDWMVDPELSVISLRPVVLNQSLQAFA